MAPSFIQVSKYLFYYFLLNYVSFGIQYERFVFAFGGLDWKNGKQTGVIFKFIDYYDIDRNKYGHQVHASLLKY